MTDKSHLVIGGGLIGMAAAKYMAAEGAEVVVFAPPEPTDPETHNGVYASHYDQRRLTHITGRNAIWVAAGRRAIGGYRDLEAQAGIDFYEPVGALMVKADNVHERYGESSIENARKSQIEHQFYPEGDRSWRDQFGDYDFPETHSVLYEPAPAGMIDPRAMLAAQAAVATGHGADVVPEMVTDLVETSDGVVATTQVGETYYGRSAVIAAGSFTNLCGLLPKPLALQVKCEVIVLGEVSSVDAARLGKIPTVSYSIEHPELADIYLAPPVRYEDGSYYFKLGANTVGDLFPTTLAEAQDWFRYGNSDRWLEPMASALQALLPAVDFLSFQTRRCIITRTPNQFPVIDQVSDRLSVAAGGNGSSAKCGDTWGYLAAGLVLGEWPEEFPRNEFRAN